MKILLSFVGINDEGGKNNNPDGAILTALKERKFDEIYLLYNPDRMKKKDFKAIAEKVKSEIIERKHCKKVHIEELKLNNVVDHNEIYPKLRQFCLDNFLSGIREEKIELFASVSSGTPTMQACWILLAESGDFPIVPFRVNEPAIAKEMNEPLTFNIKLESALPKIISLELENIKLREELDQNISGWMDSYEIIGKTKIILRICKRISQLSKTNINVLLTGETGVGKDVYANALHKSSGRKGKFIPVNCAAIPKELFNSELFGHVKGAFSGAITDRTGKIKAADKGTLFLDEIGELPLDAQSKLFRVLESKKFSKLGKDDEEEPVDFKLVCATNRNLKEEIHNNNFRPELYHRIAGDTIEIPPLRERRDDIILYIDYFLKTFKENTKKEIKFDSKAKAFLKAQDWPGNIREISKFIEKVASLSPEELVSIEDVKEEFMRNKTNEIQTTESVFIPDNFNFDEYLKEKEKKYYTKALEEAKTKKQAAELLGIEEKTFLQRCKKLGITKK